MTLLKKELLTQNLQNQLKLIEKSQMKHAQNDNQKRNTFNFQLRQMLFVKPVHGAGETTVTGLPWSPL